MTVICDTSGLLALADGDDCAHAAVSEAFAAAEPPYIVSPLVLAELDHLLRVRGTSADARASLRAFTTGDFDVAALSREEVRRAVDLDERYAELNAGLTDCMLPVLAARYCTRDLLTLDLRAFRAIKPLRGGAFRLLPADAQSASQ